MNIRVSYESARGCGYRQGGGIYLVTDGIGRYCGALPIPLGVCPTCHAGFKPARGWTWVNLAALAAVKGCRKRDCGDCPIADAKIQEVGLLWVGEKFYPTPDSFSSEATAMGISRRIAALPRHFKLGETWVALAHRKAIREVIKRHVEAELELPLGIPAKGDLKQDELPMEVEEEHFTPAIFHVFKPARIEYIVRGSESEEDLEKLEKRGFSLVQVVPKVEKEAA